MAHAIHALTTVEYVFLTPTAHCVRRDSSARSVRTDVGKIVQEHATSLLDTVRTVARMGSTQQKEMVVNGVRYIARYANHGRNALCVKMGTSVKFVKTDVMTIAVHATKLLDNAYSAKPRISGSMDSVRVAHTVVDYVSLLTPVPSAMIHIFYSMGCVKVARMGVDFALLKKSVSHVRMDFRVQLMIAVFINVRLMVYQPTTFRTKMADVESGSTQLPTFVIYNLRVTVAHQAVFVFKIFAVQTQSSVWTKRMYRQHVQRSCIMTASIRVNNY